MLSMYFNAIANFLQFFSMISVVNNFGNKLTFCCYVFIPIHFLQDSYPMSCRAKVKWDFLLFQKLFDALNSMAWCSILHKNFSTILKSFPYLWNESCVQDLLMLVLFHGTFNQIKAPHAFTIYGRPNQYCHGMLNSFYYAVIIILFIWSAPHKLGFVVHNLES